MYFVLVRLKLPVTRELTQPGSDQGSCRVDEIASCSTQTTQDSGSKEQVGCKRSFAATMNRIGATHAAYKSGDNIISTMHEKYMVCAPLIKDEGENKQTKMIPFVVTEFLDDVHNSRLDAPHHRGGPDEVERDPHERTVEPTADTEAVHPVSNVKVVCPGLETIPHEHLADLLGPFAVSL